jgi:hypothetical protein
MLIKIKRVGSSHGAISCYLNKMSESQEILSLSYPIDPIPSSCALRGLSHCVQRIVVGSCFIGPLTMSYVL